MCVCILACIKCRTRSGTTKHLTRHLRYSTARTYVSLDKNVWFFCFYRMHYITLEWRVVRSLYYVSAHPLQILSLSAAQNHFHISSICRINLPVVTVAIIFHIWVFYVFRMLFLFSFVAHFLNDNCTTNRPRHRKPNILENNCFVAKNTKRTINKNNNNEKPRWTGYENKRR